ncbi:MAG: histone deacetylase [Myxococcota bacterium]|nr:histone deacetylase [Myxococcota bacterium]
MTQLLIGYDPRMMCHHPLDTHPESPDRLTAIMDAVRPISGWERHPPARATRDQLERIHTNQHLDTLETYRGRAGHIDADTATSPGTVEAAYLAAGTTLGLVDSICRGPVKRAFSVVRPPGHHAEPDRAMGFCFLSNVAISAAHAIASGDAQRVLIIDWDVHHGNGTQQAFYDRNDVFFVSLHQSPLYPGTGQIHERGHGDGLGYTLNLPLPAGTGNALYVALFNDCLRKVARRFDPDLIMVSAGFDGHRDDPLAGMRLDEDGFAALCGICCEMADEVCDGRLCLVLEGGYNLAALGRSVAACVRVLTGERPPQIEEPAGHAKTVYDTLMAALMTD